MNKLKDFAITMQKLVWKNEQDKKARAKQQHLTNGLAVQGQAPSRRYCPYENKSYSK